MNLEANQDTQIPGTVFRYKNVGLHRMDQIKSIL